ncbi:MAG: ABC transporter permease [Pseudohongiella sp.]|nr:ABC transporter permease [Pseudohongiella sp.]
MAVSLLVLAFVNHERGFDSMHPDSDRLYRLNWVDIGAGVRFATFQNPMGPRIIDALPEVESGSRFVMREVLLTVDGNSHYEEISMVEDNYFDMFNYGVRAGNPSLAIQDINTAVLTQASAQSLFGDADPIGQSFTVNNQFDYIVSAVVENNPSNSHLIANHFINLANFPKILGSDTILEQFRADNVYQYVKLAEGVNVSELGTKTEEFLVEVVDPTYDRQVIYQPFQEIHFNTSLQNELSAMDEALGLVKPFRQRSDIFVFSAAAILTLIIATFNFVNLQIVQGSRRAREIGIRRAIGATRIGIGKQLLFETVLMSFLAMFLAVTIYQAVAPVLASMLALPLAAFSLLQPSKLIALLLLPILLGLLAGFYPAAIIAGVAPVKAMKGELLESISSSKLSSGLVILQFSISIGLIIAAAIVNSQIQFAFSKPLGFVLDDVVLVSVNTREARSAYSTMLDQLQAEPDIVSVTMGSTVPTQSLDGGANLYRVGEGSDVVYSTRRVNAGTDYFDTLGIDIVAGREFDPDIRSDRLQRNASDQPFYAGVILNQTAARAMGWSNPADAVGQPITGRIPGIQFNGTILGIASDMHYRSIRTQIEAVSYILAGSRGTMAIKINSENPGGALAAIDRIWQQNVPGYPIQRTFLEDDYSALYLGENRTFRLFIGLSVTAIVIAALGLFALASFATERRIKEISIRKVLGATVAEIAAMLSWNFSKLVVLANLIAWPVAWWVMQDWLGNFSYRVEMNFSLFLFAGLLTFVVAMVTTFQRAYSVATVNPVEALRAD